MTTGELISRIIKWSVNLNLPKDWIQSFTFLLWHEMPDPNVESIISGSVRSIEGWVNTLPNIEDQRHKVLKEIQYGAKHFWVMGVLIVVLFLTLWTLGVDVVEDFWGILAFVIVEALFTIFLARLFVLSRQERNGILSIHYLRQKNVYLWILWGLFSLPIGILIYSVPDIADVGDGFFKFFLWIVGVFYIGLEGIWGPFWERERILFKDFEEQRQLVISTLGKLIEKVTELVDALHLTYDKLSVKRILIDQIAKEKVYGLTKDELVRAFPEFYSGLLG